MKKSKFIALFTGAAVFASLVGASAALAAAPGPSSNTGWQGRGGMMSGRGPGVFGQVTAVNGNTISVASRMPRSSATTTYVVNASAATVYKNNATSSLSNIAIGDTVLVQGTVNGTSITATVIRDGLAGKGPGYGNRMMGGAGQAIFQGNGQPVLGGNVTAITGNTLTLTNKSNTTYTVDASSATVMKDNATSSLSSIAVGDNVLVQGTVNGTSIAATTILDQGVHDNAPIVANSHGLMGGFLGAMRGFFHRMFSFF